MRAIRVNQAGGNPVLEEIPTPKPGSGEVAVTVRACALNFADLLMTRGEYQDQPPYPLTLGMEIAGEVSAVGDGISAALIGRRMAAFPGSGGLADTCLLRAERLVALPDGVSFDTAASAQVAYGTSHLALSRVARLRPGERLLVLGAAGGVGLTAVELGRLMGAEVVAVARGPEKGEVARKAGAQHVLDSETDELKSAVRDLGGADVVYDPVGGPIFRDVLSATNPEGRILLIGFASGQLPEIRPNHLLVKNVSVHGVYWGGYMSFYPDALTDSLATVFRWLAEGRITPHISHTLPLDRATEALELLRDRKSTGKVVVKP